MANSVGDEGLSVLITHRKSEDYDYFDKVKLSFNHIIYLPNEATYTTEILKWLICGFTEAGLIGVDYDSAHRVLSSSKKSYCSKIRYKNIIDLRNSINEYLLQTTNNFEKSEKASDCLLGIWVPRDVGLADIVFIVEEVSKVTSEEVVTTCLFNESDTDESWTISLLSSGS